MRLRPLTVFTSIAVLMVCWLVVRMWYGELVLVWAASCAFGAWAPLLAAAVSSYVGAVGDREHSIAVAWLVRAVGMHLLLVWMLGVSDWLRGPPGHPSGWNSDTGAPLVLLLFVPTFALGLGATRWLGSVARRLVEPVMHPVMPVGVHADAVPFRGVSWAVAGVPAARSPVAVSLLGGGACVLACGTSAAPYWLLGACALLLAVLTGRNHRALGPSVAALAALAGVALSRVGTPDVRAAVGLAVAWPWLALGSVGCYLVALEALLRMRRTLGAGGMNPG
jgi:hypothetical protein